MAPLATILLNPTRHYPTLLDLKAIEDCATLLDLTRPSQKSPLATLIPRSPDPKIAF